MNPSVCLLIHELGHFPNVSALLVASHCATLCNRWDKHFPGKQNSMFSSADTVVKWWRVGGKPRGGLN